MSSGDPPPQALGSARIDVDERRVEVPADVSEWGVLSPGGDAYWAYDPAADRLVVTRSEPGLEEYPNLNRVDETRVTDDGWLALPDAIVADGDEFPWSGYLEGAETCYFDAPGEMLNKQLSYLLDGEGHDAFLSD